MHLLYVDFIPLFFFFLAFFFLFADRHRRAAKRQSQTVRPARSGATCSRQGRKGLSQTVCPAPSGGRPAWSGGCPATSKTKVMFFPGSTYFLPSPIFVQGVPLDFVQRFKYLGFWVTDRFSPLPHVDHCQSKMFAAAKLIGGLLRKLEVTDLSRLKIYFHF